MVWEPEIEELERRKQLAARMGGPEGIERQRKRGKLTVRERFVALADTDSFQEIGGLAGGAVYRDGKLESFTPSNMLIATSFRWAGEHEGILVQPRTTCEVRSEATDRVSGL